MTPAPVIHSLLQESAPLPLIRLRRVPSPHGAGVRVLLGSFSPAGSVFDAVAASLLLARRPSGGWKPGQRLVIPSVADLGVSLALAAKREGLDVSVITPESISLERRELLRFYGARVVPAPEGSTLAALHEQARHTAKEQPDALLVVPEQDELIKLASVQLGRAILAATPGAPTATFACGAGTGATFLGLRASLPKARAVLLTCAGPHPLQGWAAAEALGTDLKGQADETRQVSIESAWETRRRLGREEGMLVSLSSAANVAGALALAAHAEPGTFVDTVAWSTGERDFSIEARER